MNEPLPIFVYGSLKQGESRHTLWPHEPMKVCPATLRAALYDLGPYPALGEGDDLIAGELWVLNDDHVDSTLNILDEIEGYQQQAEDLYVRRIATCTDMSGKSQRAYAYFYANDRWLRAAKRIQAGKDGICRWSKNRDDRKKKL